VALYSAKYKNGSTVLLYCSCSWQIDVAVVDEFGNLLCRQPAALHMVVAKPTEQLKLEFHALPLPQK
jgi:hypothetical protein